jgi:hypothetical protein
VWSAVGAAGVAGDVGLAVGAVVSGAGAGLMQVFTERDIPDVVDVILDEPFPAGPVL